VQRIQDFDNTPWDVSLDNAAYLSATALSTNQKRDKSGKAHHDSFSQKFGFSLETPLELLVAF
jgi:hypothetical protein